MSAVKSTVVVTDDEKTLESSYLHFKDDLTIQIHIEKMPPEPGQKLHLDIMFTAFKSNCLLFIESHAIILFQFCLAQIDQQCRYGSLPTRQSLEPVSQLLNLDKLKTSLKFAVPN